MKLKRAHRGEQRNWSPTISKPAEPYQLWHFAISWHVSLRGSFSFCFAFAAGPPALGGRLRTGSVAASGWMSEAKVLRNDPRFEKLAALARAKGSGP
jgi:hypothetical protein